jgi:hypothetical protein
VLLAAGSAASGAALVACIDLFHSTNDVLTACQLDAQTPGCGEEAATDFCAWSADVARQNAMHACAWLGACETPLGRNAFGSCMFEALLAYDCAANPDHPVKGKTRELWDCLWQADTCEAVNACVFPQGPQQCGGGPFVTCASQGGAPHPNADVRVECPANGAPPSGENCALWGQTCGGNLSIGVCGGSAGDAAIACSGASQCDGSMLHVCDDAGRDIGIDCTNNGAQQCNGFPTATASAWVACVPESDAGKCTADLSVQCDGGIASSCRAGVPETLDCQSLLQDVHACHAGSLWPPYDWTSPCFVASGEAGADDAGEAPDASACASDSCSGTTLTGCYRGASFPLDCGKVGLGPCHMVTTDQGTTMNAACAHP